MARSQQVSGSRQTLAYAVFIGVTFGLAVSVVTMTRRAEQQGPPLREVLSLQVMRMCKDSCIPCCSLEALPPARPILVLIRSWHAEPFSHANLVSTG